QGRLLLLEVQSRKPLTQVTAEWNSKSVPFWQVSNEHSDATPVAAVDRRQALLGVDLEKPPGTYPVLVHVQTASDKPESCTLRIPIDAGRFAIERLQVGKEFVEPIPENGNPKRAALGLVTCCLHVDEHGISPGRFFQVDSKKGLAPIDRRRRSGIRVFVRNLPEGNALRVPLGGYLGQRLAALHFQKEQAPLA